MHDDLTPAALIPLMSRMGRLRGYAIVDAPDFARLAEFPWRLSAGNYAGRDRGRTLMHRQIMGCVPGDGTYVDHRNGDTLDNRRANLRLTTPVGNGANRTKPNANSTTGYRGVSVDRRSGRFRAHAKIAHRYHSLGEYATAQEAALAAAEFRLERMATSDGDRDLVDALRAEIEQR